jgi:hypothetical protein
MEYTVAGPLNAVRRMVGLMDAMDARDASMGKNT